MSDRLMTDDEAQAILQSADLDAWIRWDDANNKPDWTEWNGTPSITIDGDLTVEQMRALINFAPRETP